MEHRGNANKNGEANNDEERMRTPILKQSPNTLKRMGESGRSDSHLLRIEDVP